MAVIGAILGDIIGSQYEYDRTDNPQTCKLITDESTFTDDTVMTLAVKKAIDTNTDFTQTMREVGMNYPICGYGHTFFDWIFCKNPKPYNSFGNGAAMRVSYIGEYFENIEDVKKYAELSASVSHNHPEGIKGAVTTAVCIWMAKHRKSKDTIFEYVLEQYPTDKYRWSLDKDLKYLQKNYSWDITCMTSVPVAVRCFYESADYISFIRNVLSLDCDADTLCAIGGGIAEEFYGKTGFKDMLLLEDFLDKKLFNICIGNYEPKREEKYLMQNEGGSYMSDEIEKNNDNISDDKYYYVEVTDMDYRKWLGWSGGANHCGLYHTSEPNAVPFPIETLNCKEMQDFLKGRKYIIHSNKENLQCRRKRLCYPENLKIIYRKNFHSDDDGDN